MSPKANFEKFLIDKQLLTPEALRQALREAHGRRLTLAQVLIEKGVVGEEALARAAAECYAAVFVPAPLVFSPELVAEFSSFSLRRHRIIPLSKTDKSIVVATASPGDLLAVDEIRKVVRLPVEWVVTTDSAIGEALQRSQPADAKPAAVSAAVEAPPSTTVSEPSGNTASWVDQMLERAFGRSASDIHIEPHAAFGIVRERVDGVLYETSRIPLEPFAAVVSRLKLLAGMDIVEKRLAQDGRFRHKISGGGVAELRASTLPTLYGESLVLRVLRSDVKKPSLELLALPPQQENLLREIADRQDGLVLVAGPTGSGKTTTIYAMLELIDRKTNNLITVEDPVEYELELANQVPINTKVGVTFASILPSILRQDPDVLMVGEVRDELTCQMVMRAAISGHLVFSTIHAPNALQTVTRLMDMGVELHLINASLKACLSQRLVRKLCDVCKESYEASAEEKQLLGVAAAAAQKLYRPKGCEACHRLGYSGRFAVLEVLCLNDSMHEAIAQRDRKALLAAARAEGFVSMREAGVARVLQGATSVREWSLTCSG